MMRWQQQTNSAKTHDVTRKWWLYPSLAAIVFTGMTLTGTTAQAATDDQSATATTGTETPAATQTIQEKQVMIGQAAPDMISAEVTPENETETPEVQEPETPEVQESETQEPDAQAPDTQTPDTPDASTNGAAGESEEPDATDEVGTEVTDKSVNDAKSRQSLTATTKTDLSNQSEKTNGVASTDKKVAASVKKASQDVDAETDLSAQVKDPNLLAAIRRAFNLTDGQPLTLAMIQAYNGNYLSIKSSTGASNGPNGVQLNDVNDLTGLDILGNLPDKVRTSVDLTLGVTKESMPNLDLNPLQSLHLSSLTLNTSFWGAATDDQLRVIAGLDPSGIGNLDFSPVDSTVKNLNGLTTRQLKILAPFIADVVATDNGFGHAIVLAGNSINDFSPLGIINKLGKYGAMITGWLQSYEPDEALIAKPGENISVNPHLVGIWGDTLPDKLFYKNTDGTTVQATDHVLVNPKLVDGQAVYGQLGWQEKYVYRINYNETPDGQPLNDGLIFIAGATIYQNVRAAEAKGITVHYLDDTTGATLSSETLTGDLGATADYQTTPTIQTYQKQGYELVSDAYPTMGAQFTETEQAFYVHLKHATEVLGNSKSVNQQIHYQYVDGTTAAPTYQAWVTFVRKGSRDKVTGKTTWEAWHPTSETADLPAKTSPLIPGFTADQAEVPAVTGLTATSGDHLTVVTYTADGGTVTPPIVPPVEPPVTPEVPDEGGDGDTGTPETPTPEIPAPTPEPEQPATGGDADTGVTGETKPTKPSQPGSPVIGGQAATVAGRPGKSLETPLAAKTFATTPKIASQSATTLPQTNEQRTSSWTLLGALGLALAGVVGIRRRKDEK